MDLAHGLNQPMGHQGPGADDDLLSQPRSIISQMSNPILATVMAPAKVPTRCTQRPSPCRSRTSAASPNDRPPNEVWLMRQELVKILDFSNIQGRQGRQAVFGPVMKFFGFSPHVISFNF